MQDAILLMNNLGKKRTPFIFLIDFECKKPLIYNIQNCTNLYYNFNGFTNYDFTNKDFINKNKKNFFFNKNPISLNEYAKKFYKIKNKIHLGKSYLVNLCIDTPITTNIQFKEIFENTTSKYCIWLKNKFICFSPETFIKIKNNKIFSFPMKGTINAQIKNAKEILLNNKKEQAEHATIVDLIRNDLSKIAKNVTVLKYRFYQVIKTNHELIGQTSSKIVGNLDLNYRENLGNIIFNLLPAGSISGAPKQKTIDIIKQVEQKNRGYFTGIAGYFDGNNVDSCVLIRFINNKHIFKSGGGITNQSILLDEYNEIIQKIYVPIY